MTMRGSGEAIRLEPAEPFLAMKLRVLIADDERLCRERLKRFLHTEPGTEVVAECASGTEALEAIKQLAPDIVFLDVRMPGLDAFAVVQALGNQPMPAIILVTAFDHFALRAFEIDAVDYLLKPFNRPRFQTALRRARHRLHPDRPRQDVSSSSEESASAHSRPRLGERLTIRSAGRITLLKPAEIDWITAADNYVELHVGTRVHLIRMSLSSLAERLGSHRFARISRSILVNLDRIQEIRSKSHGDYFVVLSTGVSLAGSRNYRLGLESLLKTR